jgi:hypothetical protein
MTRGSHAAVNGYEAGAADPHGSEQSVARAGPIGRNTGELGPPNLIRPKHGCCPFFFFLFIIPSLFSYSSFF